MNNFKAQYDWKGGHREINRGFSFQKIDKVDLLFDITLNKKISDYPAYWTVKIFLEKRHLFTHRSGLIDAKFIDAYNDLEQDPEKILSQEIIGQKMTIDQSIMFDTVTLIKNFVKYIVEK